MPGSQKKRRDTDTRADGHVKKEAEMEVMQP